MLIGREFTFINNHYSIQLNVTILDISKQNRPAERAGRVLIKKIRVLYIKSGLPPRLEGKAIKALVYLVNHMLTRNQNNS